MLVRDKRIAQFHKVDLDLYTVECLEHSARAELNEIPIFCSRSATVMEKLASVTQVSCPDLSPASSQGVK